MLGVARPEGFEPPAFWFVGGICDTEETTPTYKSQRNQQKQSRAFGWFRLGLYPVHGHLHGHFGGRNWQHNKGPGRAAAPGSCYHSRKKPTDFRIFSYGRT